MPSAEAIEEELIRRELARRHMADFADYMFPGYLLGPPHELICRELDQGLRDVAAGRDVRLIFTLPPGTGKSLLISRLFPAKVLGMYPDWRLMLTSYGADLAHDHSRGARNLLRSDEYANLFGRRATFDEDETPVELAADSQNVRAWSLAPPHRGGMAAAGVGGALTGRRFRVGLIDDPIKDWDTALSEVILEKHVNWYQSTFYTRRELIGATMIVVVMTRWAVGDLVGYLRKAAQADPHADQFREIRIPALSETEEERGDSAPDALGRSQPGRTFWPGVVSEEQLRTVRANLSDLVWYGLQQQQPRVAEGNLIKRHWFRYLDPDRGEVPGEGVGWVRYWDLAQTKKQVGKNDPDFSVGSKVGRWRYRDGDATETRTIIADQQSCQESPANVKKLIKDTARADGYAVPIVIEVVATWQSFFQELVDDEDLAGYTLIADRPHTDKVVRSAAFRSRAEVGRVYLIGHNQTKWIAEFLAEATEFPNGPHDDHVDSTVGGYNHFLPTDDDEFVGSAPPLIRSGNGWNGATKNSRRR